MEDSLINADQQVTNQAFISFSQGTIQKIPEISGIGEHSPRREYAALT